MRRPIGDKPRVLLTGASGIFGQAFIRLYSDELEIVAVEHRSPVSFADRAVEFNPRARTVHASRVKRVRGNLLENGEIERIVDAVSGLIGPIDWLINAAADTRFLGNLSNADVAYHQAAIQFQLNTIAPAALAAAVTRRFWRDRTPQEIRPTVLNLSSVSGEKAFSNTGQGFYAATKAALNMLTLHMAADLGAYDVRVNALAPGPFAPGEQADDVARRAYAVLMGIQTGRIVRFSPAATIGPS